MHCNVHTIKLIMKSQKNINLALKLYCFGLKNLITLRRSLLAYSVPLMLARARSLTLLYCFQKGIELSISFIVGIHTYAGEAAHMGGGVTSRQATADSGKTAVSSHQHR